MANNTRSGRFVCVLLPLLTVLLQQRTCSTLETTGNGPPILSLCESESSKKSSGSIIIFHPIRRTYSIDAEASDIFYASLSESTRNYGMRKTYFSNASSSKISKRELNSRLKDNPQNKLNESSTRVYSQLEAYKYQWNEKAWKKNKAFAITEQEGSILDESERKPRWTSRGMGIENKRNKRSVITGPVCSCSVRPRDTNAIFMSVMVTFYRLDSESENTLSNHGDTQHESSVACPRLSLIYDGSKVQPLACLGLESKPVTSFRLPPIRLSQLGIKLERELWNRDRMYYAAFVVNVTVNGNTELISSCNSNSEPIPSNETTTTRAIVVDEPQGTRNPPVTNVYTTGASMNNGESVSVHETSSAHIGGRLNSFGRNDTTRHHEKDASSSSSQPKLLSSLLSSSSLSTPFSSPQEGSGLNVTPAILGNGSGIVLAPIGQADEDDDSSRIILVSVLTTLIALSIIGGIVFFICRIRRLRYQEDENRPSTGYRRARPYRVISLSRLLRRASSRGTTSPGDISKYPPSTSPRKLPKPQKRDNVNMNNETRSAFTTGRNEEDGEVTKRNGINDTTSERALKFDNISSSSNSGDHFVNEDTGNRTGVINSSNSPERKVKSSTLNSMSNSDMLQVPPPVPPRRRDNGSNTINSSNNNDSSSTTPNSIINNDNTRVNEFKQIEHVTKIGNGSERIGCDVTNPVDRVIQRTHAILPISGIRLPYSNATNTTKGEIKMEDSSDGKYSIARETQSVKKEKKNIGRAFVDFWSVRVYGRIVKLFTGKRARRHSETSGKSRGYWMPGDVGSAVDELSSDGYESYVGKYDNKWLQKGSGAYRSYDFSDNYEVAKVYIHNENETVSRSGAVGRRDNSALHDLESLSDGYDNFIISRECGDPDCERKECKDANRQHTEFDAKLDLKLPRFDLHDAIHKRRGRMEGSVSDEKSDDEPFASNTKETYDGEMDGPDKLYVFRGKDMKSITMKYAEPRIQNRKIINKTPTDMKEECDQKGKLDPISRSQFIQWNKYEKENELSNNKHVNPNDTVNHGKGVQQITLNESKMGNTDVHSQPSTYGRNNLVSSTSVHDDHNQHEAHNMENQTNLHSSKPKKQLIVQNNKIVPRPLIADDENHSDITFILGTTNDQGWADEDNTIETGVMFHLEDNCPSTPVVKQRHIKYVSLTDTHTTPTGHSTPTVDQSEC